MCQEDANTGFLSWELLHDLDPPLYFLEAPFNVVRGPNVLQPVPWTAHICYAGIQILFEVINWRVVKPLLCRWVSTAITTLALPAAPLPQAPDLGGGDILIKLTQALIAG